MASKFNKFKSKKPLETTLGKAPPQEEKLLDLSHLQKPIYTNVFGLKQVISLFQTATEEVKNYVSFECDVLYECRICRTIFRSLANFILHKRNYCKDQFNHLGKERCPLNCQQSNNGGYVEEDYKSTTTEESRPVTPVSYDGNLKSNPAKSLSPIVNKLVKRREITALVKNILSEDLSSKTEHAQEKRELKQDVLLQEIDTSKSAVFQTLKGAPDEGEMSSSMKSEVMEIHGIFGKTNVVLGADGKVSTFETDKKNAKWNIPRQDLVCTECDMKFSTKKTLTSHIKYKHNKTCLVFPCPDCKETFANSWGVYRHLFKVHRRSTAQVRRMRAQIHSNAIRKDQEPVKRKVKKPVGEVKTNAENEWMNNFERDKDLQMCGGCGRKFERKAALQSHSQTCTKRIAVCNTIKDTIMKSKQADIKAKALDKPDKSRTMEVLKGAARRKAKLVPSSYTYGIQRKLPVIKERKEDKHLDNVNNFETVLSFIDTPSNSNDVDETKFVTEDPLKLDDVENDNHRFGSHVSNDNGTTPNEDDVSSDFDKAPSIEVYDISDDSCEFVAEEADENDQMKSNNCKDYGSPPVLEKSVEPAWKFSGNTYGSSCDVDADGKSFKRKRAVSCDFIIKSSKCTPRIGGENVEYFGDKADESFVARALPYMKRNELKCVSCQTSFASFYQLLWHMSLHFSWFRFQCSKCPFMSFNKNDCATHAYMSHGTPDNLMESTVLPIPKWKILSMSHNFTKLDNDEVSNKNVPTPVMRKEADGAQIKAENESGTYATEMEENIDIKSEASHAITSKHLKLSRASFEEVRHMINAHTKEVADTGTETIVLDDDDDEKRETSHNEEDENCESSDNVIVVEDDAENVKKNKKKTKYVAGSSKNLNSIAHNRPVRTRTRSVKTLQNDFIYE